MEENYSERFERLKKDGVKPAIQFIPVETAEEKFLYITGKQVPGIDENRYLISNKGNVYDTQRNRTPSQSKDKDGYDRVSVHTDHGTLTRRVYRLELLTFDYNPDHQNLQVNHSDGNCNNNDLNNLEWTTPKENTDHAMLFGLHKMEGESNPNNKLSESQVKEICEYIQSGNYFDTEISKMFGVSNTTISDIRKGKIWNKISKNYDLTKKKSISLNPEQVHEICKLLSEGKDNKDIAKMFNVSVTLIRNIKNGKVWKDVSKQYNIPH